jgi:hypothetical protein
VAAATEDLAVVPDVACIIESCDLDDMSRSIRGRHCRCNILVALARNSNLGRNLADETPGWD